MSYRVAFAEAWFTAVTNAWWDAWLTFWEDVYAALTKQYWQREDHTDLPEHADAFVDFGGGDE